MIFGARRGSRARIKRDGFLFMTLLSMGGTFFYVALTYIYNMVMVRLLPAPDYGNLAVIIAILSVIILPFNTIQGLIAREVARLEKHGRHGVVFAMVKKYFKKTFFLSFLLSLVVVLLIVLVYKNVDTFTVSLIMACLSIPFTYSLSVSVGYFEGKEAHLSVISLLSSPYFLRIVIGTMLVLSGFGLFGAAFAITLAWFLPFLIVSLFITRNWRGDTARSLNLRDSAVLMVTCNLVLGIFSYMDLFMVRNLLGPEETGFYNAANLTARLVYNLGLGIIMVLLPLSTKTGFDEKRKLLSRILMGFGLLVVPTLLIFFGSQPITEFLYTREYSAAAEPTRILVFANYFYALAYILITILWAQRKEWIPLLLTIAALPFEFLLLLILVPRFGLTGAAFAYLGACAFLFVLVAYYTATAIRKYKPPEITQSLMQ